MGNRTPQQKKPHHRLVARPGAFSTWLKSTGETSRAIAAELGCSEQTVANLRSGATKPGLALAVRIAATSKGAVPASCWLAPVKRARRSA